MKNIFLMVIIPLLLDAKIDFSKHLNPQKDDIPLSVTNVKKNDVLNLRETPSLKSKILYHIPYDAKNINTYDKNIFKKIGTNRWVPIQLKFKEGYFDGWVKGKYVKLYEKYSAIISQDLVIIYPKFLTASKTKDGWIRLMESVGFEHYSGCDERDHPKILDEFNRFDLKFKVFYSLYDFFMEENLDNYKDVTQWGWFKSNSNGFVKPIVFSGLQGFKNMIGAEGCGINTYFFKINGKILVIKEPFDDNPPITKDNKPIPKNLKWNDKKEITRYIIKNLRVF
ncbi:MAG: SH3 domain-containing protein [Sulfurovaceae bacterium]|nr:SH3 domain-containing protein [Sulfurovaceae bacterium]